MRYELAGDASKTLPTSLKFKTRNSAFNHQEI
jgi:hypothetical protein